MSPPTLACFPSHWEGPFLEEVVVLSRTTSQGILSHRSLNKLKPAVLKSRLVVFLCCSLLSRPWPSPSHGHCSKVDPLTFTFLEWSNRAHPLISSPVTIKTLQKSPGLLAPCCAAPLAGTGVVQAPPKNQGMQIQVSSCYPKALPPRSIW